MFASFIFALYILIIIALVVFMIKMIISGEEFAIFLLAMLACFLLLSTAIPISESKTEILNPIIESNEYRVVITVNNQEFQFKDAYTVKNAGKIKKVYLVKSLNGYGLGAARNDSIELVY